MDIRIGLWVSLVVALTGCASTAELTDKPFQLQASQGIAAIMLDAPRRITQISYVAKDKDGTDFEVPDTRGGPALYLVPVPAGRYCLRHFRYWQTEFKSSEDLGCLTVVAGQITFGGEIVPSIEPDQAVTDQQFNLTQFTDMLHQQFPVLAGMYPLASAPTPPAGVDATPATYAVSTWSQDLPDSRNQAIYMQNNTSWTVELTDFYLLECKNIDLACGTSKLNIMLAPFSRKQVMVVKPADPSLPYEYRYDYDDIDVD